MRRPFWNYQDEPALVLVLTGYRWTISQHANAQMEGDSEEGCQAKTDAAAALGVQTQNLQTVLQHNPDMAARTMDGIDVQGFATESARVDFVDQLLAHGATVNAGALLGAVQSLFVDMVRRNRHLTAYFFLVGEMAAHSFRGITNGRYSRTQLVDCAIETIGPISDLIVFDQSDEFLILCELGFVI